jgi:ribonuclease VapC
MIAVDTSALVAFLLNEPFGDRCLAALEAETEVLMSAGTFAECLIVAAARNFADDMAELVDSMHFEIVPVTRGMAQRVGQAYIRWGKNYHPAGLNFGDCFAYALAKEHGCPLLYVGDDFTKTDIQSAL